MTSPPTSRGVARIGVLVPFTNVNLESDLNMMRPPGVSFHFTRMGGYDVAEVPDAKQMAGLGAADLDEPLSLLVGARPDLIMYGCTSATLTHGTEFDSILAKKIQSISGAQTVTAAGSLIFALEALNARSVAFASPYTKDINKAAIQFLVDSGVDVVSAAGVEDDLGNYGQAELTPKDVYQLGLKAVSNDPEALVLSCTEMRSVETIVQLEEQLILPVITSNQAMMFQALKMLAIPCSDVPFGRLFKESDSRG